MQKELEKLWFTYLLETPTKYNDKEKEAIKRWFEIESLLNSKIENEQKILLEKHDNAVCEINSISEKNAFIKGVKFTMRINFEALYDD